MEKELLRLQKRNKELERQTSELEQALKEYISREESIVSSIIETYSLSPETTLDTLSSSLSIVLGSSTYGPSSSITTSTENATNNTSTSSSPIKSGTKSVMSPSSSQIVEFKKEILQLRQENQKLQQQNEHYSFQKDDLKSKNSEMTTELQKYRQNISLPKNMNFTQNDIEEMLKKIKDQNEKIKKQKSRIRSLNNAYSVAQAALRDSQSSRDELINQNQQLKQKINDFATQKTEISPNIPQNYTEIQLQRLLPQIVEQVSLTSDDLKKETEIKNNLLSILYKQIALFDKLSKRFESLQAKNNEMKQTIQGKENKLTEFRLQQNNTSNAQEDVIADLVDAISSSKLPQTVIHQITKIFNSPFEPFDKIKRAFIILTDNIIIQTTPEPNQVVEKPNSELLFYLKSLNKFVRSFIESNNVQDCIIGHQIQNNIKSSLIQDSKTIDKFILDNAQSMIDDTPLYNSLFNSLDPLDLQQSLNNYLEKTDEKEVSCAVEAACMSNLILRKYSKCMKEQCQIVGEELQKLKRQFAKLNFDSTTNEQQLADMQNYVKDAEKEKNEMKNKFEKLTSIIDKCIESGADLPPALIKARNNADFEENEEESENESDFNNNHSEKSKQTIDEIVRQQVGLANEKNEHKIKKFMKAIKKMSDELEACKKESNSKQTVIDQLDTEIIGLNQQIEKISKTTDEELNNANEILEKTREEYDLHITQICTDYETKISQIQSQMLQTRDDYEDHIKDLIRDYEMQVKTLKSDLSNHDSESESLRRRYEPIVQELNEKLSQTIERELNLKAQVKDLQEKISESQNSIANYDLSSKLSEVKHRDEVERIKREAAMNNSKMQAKIIAQEDKYKSEIEQLKSKHEIEKVKIIEDIAKPFSVVLGIEGLDENVILQTTKSEVESYRKLGTQFSSSISELSEIRGELNIPSEVKVKDFVLDVLKKMKDVEAKNVILSNGYNESHSALITARVLKDADKRLKDWESWARKVYFIINESAATSKSTSEIRRNLEESLIASSTDRTTVNKLASLRAQKALLLQGCLNKAKRKYQGDDWCPLIALAVFIRRIERLSGNIATPLSLPQTGAFEKKKWSIVSTKVVTKSK
ncbi:hypothetical protein TVAG_034750 [Trichomonas vaginalis G3]|uniref:Viral A-type inclusion protein n=1 Tax=Trichomonas vaginalis (strain ATCC PRA-98 / G3) TaxID=412133 RepID=A2FJ85_TRIV3|nr:hypothetical protein TVAGG3_0440830 [Trichomonas vaginalis G3]EAX95046.1 hypothetical protein TVAG_034750 [Trichomonas vaginalis G3]KAI5537447.1 hypothetical protein TVAGG3_0440830 [Trichomonas vaginalis G3]|eukprot:XP_001307976.1 hypothetical protein [Trichomonas vaginalis G3]